MKKADMILIGVILLVAAALSFSFFSHREKGAFARISVDGVVMQELPLEQDASYLLEIAAGYNRIEIENKQVFVSEADCRDGICVEHKKISRTKESIVCLPHKMVVEVIGAKEAEFDMVVG